MNKYNAKKTEVDGIIFDSKAEALFYKDWLIPRSKTGELKILKLQPEFQLQPRFKRKITKARTIREQKYVADFLIEIDGLEIVIDVKGFTNDKYRLKRALFLYRYKYPFWEVRYDTRKGIAKIKEF